MATQQDEGDRIFGPPRVSLIPRPDEPDATLPSLHSNRDTGHACCLHAVGSPEAWYPAAVTVRPGPIDWETERNQKRWLHYSHPGAFTGAHGVLSDFMQREEAEIASSYRARFALAQMTDFSDPKRPRPKALLAMAAGQSGELLRLTALSYANWHWGEHASPVMRLLHTDQDDLDEVSIWSQDGTPICQIKVGLDLTRYEPSRYVIVQKKLSTAILKPQYRRVPVAGRHTHPSIPLDRPSRIDPNHVLSISSTDTGGSPHSDVAFSAGSEGRPEMLAIVDERGYWSVWEILGKAIVGRSSLSQQLRACGHIQAGVLGELPSQVDHAIPLERHGILWLDSSKPNNNHWDGPLHFSASAGIANEGREHGTASLPRLAMLLVWNSSSAVLIDLHRPTGPISRLDFPGLQQATILDVKTSPGNQSHMFILTDTSLYWADLSTAEGTGDGPWPRDVKVLVSCAHLRDCGHDLCIQVHHGDFGPGGGAGLVCLSSRTMTDVDAFTFSFNPHTGLPQFLHQVVRIPPMTLQPDSASLGLQSVLLAPVALVAPQGVASGPGLDYFERQDRFWQLFALGEDLSLWSCLVAATSRYAPEISIPDTSPDVSARYLRRLRSKRRAKFLQQHAETFVVADAFGDMSDFTKAARGQPQSVALLSDEISMSRRWPRAFVEGVDLLMSRVTVSLESLAQESTHNDQTSGSIAQGFEAIRQDVQDCLSRERGSLPLRTLRDYADHFEAPPVSIAGEEIWGSYLQAIFSLHGGRAVIEPTLAEYLGVGLDKVGALRAMRCRVEEHWPITSSCSLEAARLCRQLAISEASEAVLRSLYGIAVFDEERSRDTETPSSWMPLEKDSHSHHNQPSSSQQVGYLTPRATRSLSPGPSSQPQSSQASHAAVSDGDSQGPLRRLAMLARGLDAHKELLGPPSQIIAYWPQERGVSTRDYQSSVVAASARRLENTRSRNQHSGSRQRQRKPRGSEAISHASVVGLASSSQPGFASSQNDPTLVPPSSTDLVVPIVPLGMNLQQSQMQTQPLLGSSQRPRLSQSQQFSQSPGRTMSQPTPSQFGKRQDRKKPKRRGGF